MSIYICLRIRYVSVCPKSAMYHENEESLGTKSELGIGMRPDLSVYVQKEIQQKK